MIRQNYQGGQHDFPVYHSVGTVAAEGFAGAIAASFLGAVAFADWAFEYWLVPRVPRSGAAALAPLDLVGVETTAALALAVASSGAGWCLGQHPFAIALTAVDCAAQDAVVHFASATAGLDVADVRLLVVEGARLAVAIVAAPMRFD